MLQSPKFNDVAENCKAPLSGGNTCRKCLNAGILYLRNLLGPVDNVTLSTCWDATFAAIASQVDYLLTVDIASCFFGVEGLITPTETRNGTRAERTEQKSEILRSALQCYLKKKHLTVTAGAASPSPELACHRWTRTRKFSYKETEKANNFSTVNGQGGFGIVSKAEFQDGLVAAAKRMSKISEQADDDFCRELELLARLHHRHLVALRGFCVERHERFLMYEFMANGSLKDHLRSMYFCYICLNCSIYKEEETILRNTILHKVELL